MTTGSSDLPEAAQRRLGEGAFSSGLSVNDFAACLEMGLEPVGLVQGFCAMQWGSYGVGLLQRGMTPYGGSAGGYLENYQCPHGGMMGGEHRFWGQNYQQTWIENSWNEGFSSAYSRMLEEASDLNADGVVGVLDTQSSLSEAGIIEFHLTGTAVKLKGAPAATTPPWTTYLAGQRLAKLFEAGFAPVSVIATVSSIRVWAYCMTEYLMGGAGGFAMNQNFAPQEIDQIVRAQSAARSIARKNVRDQLRGDSLHGADLSVMEREFEKGDLEVQTLLRGNRVRRFKAFEALPVPQPTVRLS
jgi:Putative heavy-metal-binding